MKLERAVKLKQVYKLEDMLYEENFMNTNNDKISAFDDVIKTRLYKRNNKNINDQSHIDIQLPHKKHAYVPCDPMLNGKF